MNNLQGRLNLPDHHTELRLEQSKNEPLIITLVVLNNLLLQLHFKLRHQSRAHVSLFAAAGLRLLGASGGQRAGYRRDSPRPLAGPRVRRRRRRQTGGNGRWRFLPGAAVDVPLGAAIPVADQELICGAGEFHERHLEGPGSLLVPGSPLNDATRRHDPVAL